MADTTLHKILELVQGDEQVSLRLAGLRVLGIVGSAKDKATILAIKKCLDDPNVEIRSVSLETLGVLKVEELLPRLQEFVRQGGPELEPAVKAASQLGAKGTKAMAQIMDSAPPGLRLRIANELAKSGTGSGLVVTAHGLLDDNPILVDSAARSLIKEVPTFSTPQRHALAKFLIESLEGKRALSVRAEAAMVRVLGMLHEAKAEDVFWSRVSAPKATEIRVAALQSLGANAAPNTDSRVQKLLACAMESDFQLVAPALVILQKLSVSVKNHKAWLPLLEAPDLATRDFALGKLQGIDRDEIAQALIPSLRHPDRSFREKVLKALLGLAKGRRQVLEQLLASDSADACWMLVRSLLTHANEWSSDDRKLLFQQACRWHDTDDRRAAALWHLLREIDHDATRDQILEKAQALRKKKKFEESLPYYRLLTQDPACGEEVRFEWACTALRSSARDLSSDARRTDPLLHQFTRFVQNPGFDVLTKLSKTKWLEPEDLFYLGFHFSEQTHRLRDFGKDVLELVAKQVPRSDLGKQAKRKLKSEGL